MSRPGTAARLRLLTFNVHHGVGADDRHDLPRLARVLAGADADVVCLQEVDRRFGPRSEEVDQPLLLSEALGMELAWGPAIDRPGNAGERRQYGNAVLSRLPLRGTEVHRLPGGGEPRSAVRVDVDLGGGTVLRVVCTHLSTRPVGDRAGQAAALAALLPDGSGPAVVVGDLNTAPGAAELSPLRERCTEAWGAAGERSDRSGWRFWHRDHGDTFPATGVRRRYDHVWVTAGVAVRAARVLDGAGASDHLPVVVDLVVRSGV